MQRPIFLGLHIWLVMQSISTTQRESDARRSWIVLENTSAQLQIRFGRIHKRWPLTSQNWSRNSQKTSLICNARMPEIDLQVTLSNRQAETPQNYTKRCNWVATLVVSQCLPCLPDHCFTNSINMLPFKPKLCHTLRIAENIDVKSIGMDVFPANL